MNQLILDRKIDPSLALKNDNEEEFCRLYTQPGEFFGNGVESYIQSFDVIVTNKIERKQAIEAASRLLAKPMVLQRLNFLLENELGFNDVNVDKQLAFLITQSSDLRVKLQAVREYNQLKGRIKKKIEISLDDKSDSELDAELEALEREIAQTEELVASQQGDVSQVKGMPILTESQKAAMQSQHPLSGQGS